MIKTVAVPLVASPVVVEGFGGRQGYGGEEGRGLREEDVDDGAVDEAEDGEDVVVDDEESSRSWPESMDLVSGSARTEGRFGGYIGRRR